MARYRKKPVVVEAMRFFLNTTHGELVDFFGPLWSKHLECHDGGSYLLIKTLEGTMRAEVGDWVIKGVKGEFYPCKPDIFAATYEPA